MSESTSGRQPITIIELDQPICNNTYGVSPCTASLGSTGYHKCFNTRETCQDADNYDPAVLPLTISFCKPGQVLPDGIGGIMLPCLDSVDTTPTELNPGGASGDKGPLGARATANIRFTDLPHSDLVVDPYQRERFSGAAQYDGEGYDPRDRATFWTKWLKRNPYYVNWDIRIREGYADQDPEEMTTRHYVIEDINGPDPDGAVTIKAQDIFGLADDDKAKAPAQSQGELDSDITDAVNTLDMVEYEDGEYPSGGGTVRIGDECMTYTGTSEAGGVLTLNGLTRGTDGTTAESHSEGDRVQLCYRVDNEYCWAVARELLEDYANVDSDFIPYTDWQSEGTTWIPTFTVTTLITEPTGVNQLLGELCQQCGFDLWWDERDQEIKFRALRAPSELPTSLNDRQHIIADSWKFDSDLKQRVSQVWLFYNQKNPTKPLDDTKNYSRVRLKVDPDLEDDNKYGKPAIKNIYSRWLETAPQAIQLTTRYLARFQNGARYLRIQCDAKDRDLWTGHLVSITLHSQVDEVGLPETKTYQIISAEEIQPGEIVEYDLQNYVFVGARFAYWMDVINCRSEAGQWTQSAHGVNEYYFDNSGGTLIGKPSGVYFDSTAYMESETEGTMGSLNAGEWDWGDNDALGYDTLYVRLNDGDDPDNKADGFVVADYPAYENLPDKDNPPQGLWWANENGIMDDDSSNGWQWQ